MSLLQLRDFICVNFETQYTEYRDFFCTLHCLLIKHIQTLICYFDFNHQAAVMLMNNGTMVETIWAESIPLWATSSNTAILNLTSGDQVWLVLLKRAPYIHGYMYSSFSGYLLFETENDHEAIQESNDFDVNVKSKDRRN